jgi:outer membrane biosynthesis protein TonB
MILARPSSLAVSLRPLAASLLLSLLAACAGDAGDWKAAQDADTQEAYEAFVARHPDSEFAPRARERNAQLLEERDWAAATRSDSPEAYQKFIGQHPDGKWTQEARIRVENFNVMAAAAPELPAEPTDRKGAAQPDSAAVARAGAPAQSAGATRPVPQPTPAPAAAPTPPPALAAKPATTAAPATASTAAPATVRTPPRAVAATAPPPAKGPAEAPAATSTTSTNSASGATSAAGAGSAGATAVPGYRVQLGAFSSVDKAEAEWTRARERFPALQSLEPRITPVQAQARRLFRLQAGVPDEASAKGLCETLKGGGQPCLVVPVK